MGQTTLFRDEVVPGTERETAELNAAEPKGKVRLREANRAQVSLEPRDLDSTLPPDHQVKTLWAALGRLDLRPFYTGIQAREGRAGRNATDPKILICLWLYATAEGIGSARELDRLCREHVAYRWICGGVSVNYHLLAEFRVGHMAALDALLEELLGHLLEAGLITLRSVAHDGMRVRASAGTASFHRKNTLKRALRAAKRQVDMCKAQADAPEALEARRAAERRSAEDKQRRLERAIEQLKRVEKARAKDPNKPRREKEPRVSATDPEARIMKMADGGFRPAYNIQLSTDVDSRLIVGVGVSNIGSDSGQLTPAIDEVEARMGTLPDELLVDGGFVNLDAITAAEGREVTVYAPVPNRNADKVDPYEPKATDSPAVADWRQRMNTDEAKEIYKDRAATAETTNADLRTHRGLNAFNVRGSSKVRCVTLWAVLAYNLLRTPVEALQLWS